jgi:MOSC domain-containing protein YiiM
VQEGGARRDRMLHHEAMPTTTPASGRLESIQLSKGGVPKLPVREARVEPEGLVGDGHRDLRHHGGPDRAVCLWSTEVIAMLRAEGHPVRAGDVGENFTVSGLPWSELTPGDQLEVGAELVLELVSYTSPCTTIAGAFADGDYSRISHKRHPGASRLYARVLRPGTVKAGDEVRRVPAA